MVDQFGEQFRIRPHRIHVVQHAQKNAPHRTRGSGGNTLNHQVPVTAIVRNQEVTPVHKGRGAVLTGESPNTCFAAVRTHTEQALKGLVEQGIIGTPAPSDLGKNHMGGTAQILPLGGLETWGLFVFLPVGTAPGSPASWQVQAPLDLPGRLGTIGYTVQLLGLTTLAIGLLQTGHAVPLDGFTGFF